MQKALPNELFVTPVKKESNYLFYFAYVLNDNNLYKLFTSRPLLKSF